MKNFNKFLVLAIAFLATTASLHASEYTDPSFNSGTAPSKVNPSPATSPGTGAINQPASQAAPQTMAQPADAPTKPVPPAAPSTSTSLRKAQASSPSNSRRLQTSYNALAEADVHTHSGALADDDIIQKIRWGIKNDKTISDKGKSIQVAAANGEVTLIGKVANQAEKSKIESLVKQIEGVKKINSKLTFSNK